MAEVDVRTGALMVVVLALTHVMVPPVASAAPGIGWELPPVTPPVHPLIVMVVEALPLIVVHLIDPAAQAGAPALVPPTAVRPAVVGAVHGPDELVQVKTE